ncbi:hypothetical protein T265_07239 [Opisthorchis viverrini]|uniref:Uncharacterized protein n=1 Tax=Opisthorchis viverrini TaxID=6198 RepID=A0A074ZHP4_OPIVI|nr:hypothetical protein T265_07239 [Opisthorchis viverrini]KER25252.1 hypothetical protein T265_07239 [Opisthorchis viverrini]
MCATGVSCTQFPADFPNTTEPVREKGLGKLSVGEPVNVRVYRAVVCSILLYGSVTWPLCAEDVKRFSVFDHRCLRSIARIWWEHRVSNSEVRRMVFGRNNSPSIDELITQHRLR